MSYTGQSSKDNSVIPPSVVVSELMDYVHKSYRRPGEEDNAEWLVVKHRLQPFNPAYFSEGDQLYSYSDEHLAVAVAMLEPKGEPPRFVPERLSDPDEAFRVVGVADLCRFFSNPARYLLNRRLGIHLEEESLLIEDVACFELDNLGRYQLEQKLAGSAIAGADPRELFQLEKATGKLPPGTPGELTFKESMSAVERFSGQTGSYLESQRLEPLDVDLSIDGFDITGRVDSLYPSRRVQYRFGVLKAGDYLRSWIVHLVLNAAEEPGYPKESMLIGLDGNRKWKAQRFSPVDHSRDILGELLQLYWEGLSRPIHFFPDISHRYAIKALKAGGEGGNPLEDARAAWLRETSNQDGRTRIDPYLRLCFKSANPIDSDFQHCSELVFYPLLNNCKEV
jgi:exodeoxyribonuclease V gamma subunit